MNAQVNTNNALVLDVGKQAELMQKYANELTDLAAAMNKARSDSDIATKARNGSKDTITLALKNFAVHTHNDGIPVEMARVVLRTVLTSREVKEGTVKASGNHFAGFRAMLADNLPQSEPEAWQKATVADAQQYIASEESKAKAQAKKEWNDHTSKWSAEQWNSFLIEQGVRVVGTASSEGEVVTEGEQADISAELAQAKPAEGQQDDSRRTGTNG